jgi:LmbE family N-acetylglucosaminyl deacetylase
MSKSVVVIAAHPDDEVLGCGATIASHVKNGDQVHVLILAEGLTSRGAKHQSEQFKPELSALRKAAEEANSILGSRSLLLKNFPDNRMDGVERLDIIKEIEDFIGLYNPQVVYTHHAGDVNIDHRCIHDAVIAACRPMPNKNLFSLLFFEVASSTEWRPPASGFAFSPNWYVNISSTLSLKIAALKAYQSEMRDWPHARSIQAIEHLAKWRGATVGVDAAEAFVLGRYIQS